MTDDDKKLREKLIRNLKIGLRAESSIQSELDKDNYGITGWAGKSKTLGKYQFVSSIHLNNIKSFATVSSFSNLFK